MVQFDPAGMLQPSYKSRELGAGLGAGGPMFLFMVLFQACWSLTSYDLEMVLSLGLQR
jgi:hypothetical protein